MAETDVLGELLSCLVHPRRRFTVFYLHQRSGPAPLTEVATELAAHEVDTTIDELTPEMVEPIEAALYHKHLPELAAAGVVDWDETRTHVTPTDSIAVAEQLRRQLVEMTEQATAD